MADKLASKNFELSACRELLETHPESLRIREQVEALEDAMPDRPGVVVSFCRTIIETTCKTILSDRNITIDNAWEAPKLVSEALRYLNLGSTDDGSVDAKVRNGAECLVRGLNQIVQGIMEIRNAHGSAAHGACVFRMKAAPNSGPKWPPFPVQNGPLLRKFLGSEIAYRVDMHS